MFGSQTAIRLAKMFMLVAILPGLFLFGVSAQFISHSIDSWFGNETEEALELWGNSPPTAVSTNSRSTTAKP